MPNGQQQQAPSGWNVVSQSPAPPARPTNPDLITMIGQSGEPIHSTDKGVRWYNAQGQLVSNYNKVLHGENIPASPADDPWKVVSESSASGSASPWQVMSETPAVGSPSQAPSLWHRIKNAITGTNTFFGTQEQGDTWSQLFHHPLTYLENAPKYAEGLATKPIVNATNAMTAQEQQAHPVVSGLTDFASNLTSPTSVAMLGVAGGMNEFAGALIGDAKLASRLMAAGFSASSIPTLIKSAKEYVAARKAGNYALADRIATEGGLSTALTFLTAHFAATGKPIPFLDPAKETARASEPPIPEAARGRVIEAASSPEPAAEPVGPQTLDAAMDDAIHNHTPIEEATQPGQPGEKVAPRAPTTMQAIREAAEKLNMQPADLFSRATATGVSAEEVVAGNMALQEGFNGLQDILKGSDLDTEEGRAAAIKGIQDYNDLRGQVRGKLAGEAGRALRATRELAEPEAAGLIGKSLDILNKLDGDKQTEALKLMQQLANADDPAVVGRFQDELAKLEPHSIWDKLHFAWVNSILSGAAVPKKAFGDFATAALAPFEELFANGPEGAKNYVRGMLTAIPHAMQAGWKVFSQDFSELDNVERGGETHLSNPAIGGKVGATIGIPGRALGAITSFFRVLHFDAAMWELSFKQAEEEGAADVSARAAELRANPPKDMAEQAIELARKRTYTSALESDLGKWLSEAPRQHGARKLIPFARIPLNILKMSYDLSPVGWTKTAWQAARDEDFRGSPQMYRQLARNTLGLVSGMYGYWAGYTGRATAALGQPSLSQRVGPVWLGYRYLTPFSMGLAASIGAGEAARLHPDSTGAQLAGAVNSTLKAVGGVPLLSSLAWTVQSLTEAIKSSAQHGTIQSAGRFAGAELNSAVPQFLSDIAAALDQFERNPKTFWQEFEERLPKLREKVPVKLQGGYPVPEPGNLGGFSPISVEPAVSQEPSSRKSGIATMKEIIQNRIR